MNEDQARLWEALKTAYEAAQEALPTGKAKAMRYQLALWLMELDDGGLADTLLDGGPELQSGS